VLSGSASFSFPFSNFERTLGTKISLFKYLLQNQSTICNKWLYDFVSEILSQSHPENIDEITCIQNQAN